MGEGGERRVNVSNDPSVVDTVRQSPMHTEMSFNQPGCHGYESLSGGTVTSKLLGIYRL